MDQHSTTEKRIVFRIAAILIAITLVWAYNHQRTQLGEVFVSKLIERRPELHLANLEMKDGVANAIFVFRKQVDLSNDNNSIQAYAKEMLSTYCESMATHTDRLDIKFFHVQIRDWREPAMLLSRILSQDKCV